MKRIFILCVFSLILTQINAQTCVADSIYADSTFGVYPPPLTMDNPGGGIDEDACNGAFYDFPFTVKLPAMFAISGFTALLDKVIVDTLLGLPNGVNYACDPPTCEFGVDSVVSGCIVLFGVPDDAPGDYDLEMKVTINTNNLGNFSDISLPDESGILPQAAGEYTLTILPDNDPNCIALGTTDFGNSLSFSTQNNPNPFSEVTQVKVDSEKTGQFEFQVFDLVGKVVYSNTIQLQKGENNFEFDGSQLTNGIYIYTIGDNEEAVSQKMIINK